MSDKMYGYKIGDIVELKIDYQDERRAWVKAGSKLRLVAFAPKVVMRPKHEKIPYPDGEDRKPYFFNAVRAEQEMGNHTDRTRGNFIIIRKVKS